MLLPQCNKHMPKRAAVPAKEKLLNIYYYCIPSSGRAVRRAVRLYCFISACFGHHAHTQSPVCTLHRRASSRRHRERALTRWISTSSSFWPKRHSWPRAPGRPRMLTRLRSRQLARLCQSFTPQQASHCWLFSGLPTLWLSCFSQLSCLLFLSQLSIGCLMRRFENNRYFACMSL